MKMCTICGLQPVETRDRNVMGRPIKRLCKECHEKRLCDDLKAIMLSHMKEREGV